MTNFYNKDCLHVSSIETSDECGVIRCYPRQVTFSAVRHECSCCLCFCTRAEGTTRHIAMSCTRRVFPLRQPKGHRPPVPRWMAQFPARMDSVFTAYIGVQQHKAQTDVGSQTESVLAAVESIRRWMVEDPSSAPASIEQFQVLDGDDVPDSTVWVCY